jgi:protein-S-isoprenylcysteine O-methyltransferase Ste14
MNRATAGAVTIAKDGDERFEPLWPPFVAMLAVGGLYAALPADLLGGAPRWLLAAIVVALLVPILILHRQHNHALSQKLGYVLNSVVTAALIVSLAFLIEQVAEHKVPPQQLLRSAAALWVSNFLVFASWYWRLDGGGPHLRALTPGHKDGAFLFPQMTMHPEARSAAGEEDWEPKFVDYLFLAFNTSTAFSPTDVPVLSRWAKILMMIQALISLLVIALLAGRAVNIL